MAKVGIVVEGVNIPQVIYIDACVVPEIEHILEKHAANLEELGFEESEENE